MNRQERKERQKSRGKPAQGCAAVLLLLFVGLFCFLLLKRPPDESVPEEPVSAVETPMPLVPEEPITEEMVLEKLETLKTQFPSGAYWNHRGMDIPNDEPTWAITTDIPCDHFADGDAYCNRYDGATKEFFPQYDHLTQCLGFSSMLSDQIFGEDAPIRIHRSFNDLKVGDQIRLTSAWHSMLVIEKMKGHVLVAECDEDGVACEISWGREISKRELMDYGEQVEYITRYA